MPRNKRAHRKPEKPGGPSGFFVATLIAGLLFLLWMVIQAILTSPFDDSDIPTPGTDAKQEATP